MSKKQVMEKNIDLSGKLAHYLAKHPKLFDKLPMKASYVVLSANDIELNKINTNLIEGLLEEGRKVVTAEETNDKESPWKFTPVTV